ncbi:MAG: hypothetical protein LBU38_08200 [Propionibacteriaceae bacterium]|jgi:Kef-type K+ transport system membrane component KefB|nr:hypothetical protein [Propionibacteriaceae bacterium]
MSIEMLGAAGSIMAITCASALILTYVLGRLQLTDWLGYLISGFTILGCCSSLVKTSIWVAVLGTLVGVVLAFLWALFTVRAYRKNPDLEFSGFFVVGKPPKRVRGWPRQH